MIAVAGPWIVAVTFLWAGIIKAASPHVFQVHLNKLGAIPREYVPASIIAAAGVETGWGLALLLGVAPRVVLPATAMLLVVFTLVSWWGVRSGRTTDCGCYGGYVVPSLAQSIALNATMIALTILAWLASSDVGSTPAWKLILVTAVTIAAGAFAAASLNYQNKHGRFLFDLTPLKIGRTWRSRWGTELTEEDEHLVSYLGPDCPHCKDWVRVLNAIDQTSGLPDVVGVVASSNEQLEKFVEISGIRFPMRIIPQTLMSRLAWGVPTTVLVSKGRIRKQWSGHMPPEFFHRLRDSFFPGAADAAPDEDPETLATLKT